MKPLLFRAKAVGWLTLHRRWGVLPESPNSPVPVGSGKV